MKRSEAINELATALAKAQGAIKPAPKSSENPHFKYRYADLASVWDACRGPLSENGLAVIQTPIVTEAGVELETLLAHSSGQWLSETLVVPVGKRDVQGIGSAITYARRYMLAAFIGIAPDDDDGEAAVHHDTPRQQRPQHSPAPATQSAPPPPAKKMTFEEFIESVGRYTTLDGCQKVIMGAAKYPPEKATQISAAGRDRACFLIMEATLGKKTPDELKRLNQLYRDPVWDWSTEQARNIEQHLGNAAKMLQPTPPPAAPQPSPPAEPEYIETDEEPPETNVTQGQEEDLLY